MNYPQHFIPETVVPTASDELMTEWAIGDIPAKGSSTITIQGSFASDANGKMTIRPQIGIRGEGDTFLLQKETEFSTDVLEGNLVTLLILNGKGENQPVRFGDTLHYAITYRNTGTVALGDVAFTVNFATQPNSDKVIAWNDVRDPEEGVRSKSTITWSKKQISSLAKLLPNQEGAIDFDIPILKAPFEGSKETDYSITSWVETTVQTIDGEPVKRTTKTQPIVARALSDTDLSSAASYFNTDGIPVGSGPLPPKVGEPTTYRVTWTVSNSLHELADLKISAKLPPNAIWTGKSSVDAGEFRFDAGEEKLFWTLNWLPTTIKKLTASVDIALTPSDDQAGKVATLVDATIMEATDKLTGAHILLSTPPITTALENDEGAEGKGRVQE
jgi:hypothetical protein